MNSTVCGVVTSATASSCPSTSPNSKRKKAKLTQAKKKISRKEITHSQTIAKYGLNKHQNPVLFNQGNIWFHTDFFNSTQRSINSINVS